MAGIAEKIVFAAKIAGVNVDDLADYLVVEGIQNFDNVTAQDIASRYVNSGLFD
jgi:hypothetical protein